MNITFKKQWFFGGDIKDDDNDWICAYAASTGETIKVETCFSNESIRWYMVDGKSFDYLKLAKAYIISKHNS
jgi:hypothetical protein